MKVLKDNYKQAEYVEEVNNDYPRKLVCEKCESELEYDKTDVVIGEYGCAFVNCPLCGYNNYLDDGENDINLTMHNVEFPVHFGHTCEENGAVNCLDNKRIKEYVRKAIDYFRKNKNENYWFTACGNLHIHVSRWEGDESYDIVVTDDYYETSIPFEEEDY